MTEQSAGVLCVMGGILIMAGSGVVARRSLRRTSKAHRRTRSLLGKMPEGLAMWFLGGFSDLTLASRRLLALVTVSLSMGLGVILVVIGLRLSG